MRLTKRDSAGNALKNCEDCEIKFRESCCSKQLCLNALINKLATYEDTEEQGKLVILPCKVGDALFVTDEGTILPAVRMVESITWWDGKISILAVNEHTGSTYRCFAEDFGETVFLTREEAKAAMGRGQDDV